MHAIRIRKTINSDTIHLPELRAFIGHTVDIVIQDELQPDARLGVVSGTGDWDALLNAAQSLKDYDYEAQRDQDACDVHDAQDHLR